MGKYRSVVQRKVLANFMAIWPILQPYGIFNGHLAYFTAIWNILWPFGLFYSHMEYSMAIWLYFGIFFPF
jgi:hypothetical protein